MVDDDVFEGLQASDTFRWNEKEQSRKKILLVESIYVESVLARIAFWDRVTSKGTRKRTK